MEKDTVVLNIRDYNELRDFKQYIEKNYTLKVSSFHYSRIDTYITKDEAVKEVVDKLNEATVKFKEVEAQLIDKIRELQKNSCKVEKEITIDDIKNMSYWEFRTSKKQSNK